MIRFTNEQVDADPDECARGGIVMKVFGLLAEENPVAVIRDERERWYACPPRQERHRWRHSLTYA